MKKTLAILFVLLPPLYAFSQGDLNFDNFSGSSGPVPVTISDGLGTFNPTNGSGGAYVGADYTASLYFLNGVVTNQAVFDSSNPILSPSADTRFLGTTSTGPGSNGGFFDGGIAYLPTSGVVTVQVRAWYNGGGLYTSYAQALADGQNVGESNPVSLTLALGASQPPFLDGLSPFTVGVVPEPSVYMLLGLGGLLLFRQRKIALRS